MKLAIIDKKDITLKLENNSIKYEEHTIPFKLVDMLILNHRTTLYSNDILKLTKENINILFISYNNTNFSLINSANTKNGDLKLLQYKALCNRLKFAKYFIKEKFISHKEQLETNNINVDIKNQLEQIENSSKIDELMGIEGNFSREYFKYFFQLLPKELHKNKRTKQPPRDPVNAVMSYWYSLYYYIITSKLLSNGFEPAIGFLHTPFRAHNALASDILELFRANINQAVIGLFKNKLLTIEDFSKKGGVYLKFEGRKKIWKEFALLVEVLNVQLDSTIAVIRKMCNETHYSN